MEPLLNNFIVKTFLLFFCMDHFTFVALILAKKKSIQICFFLTSKSLAEIFPKVDCLSRLFFTKQKLIQTWATRGLTR